MNAITYDETLHIGDVHISIVRKDVKRVQLSVLPPHGDVVITAPESNRIELLRAYAVAQLTWIRQRQQMFIHQARETERTFVTRESHYLWGRRYLLDVIERDAKPEVKLDHTTLTLYVRPESSKAKKAQVMHDWHKKLLHACVPELIAKWEKRLHVAVSAYYLQRMKTKWGNCNAESATIRLNTELVKKPKDLLEYVVVHELLHLIEPKHSEYFFELLSLHYPQWQEARMELNALPLAHERWNE